MKLWFPLAASHIAALGAGFAAGVYALPILTAPAAPEQALLEQAATTATFTATFDRTLPGSDLFHWGEGTVSLSPTQITHMGRLAPGPDYKLYLVPDFVQDEAQFLALKDASLRLGDIKTFDGFLLALPPGVDLAAYTTVLVWCEAFGQFISAAKYR